MCNYQRNSDTREQGNDNLPPNIRNQILIEACHYCCVCIRNHASEVHHIIPRSRGGTNDPENLIALCRNCHGVAHVRGGLGISINPQQLRLAKDRCKNRERDWSRMNIQEEFSRTIGDLTEEEKRLLLSILSDILYRLGIIASALRKRTASVNRGDDDIYRFCFHHSLDIIVETIEPNIVKGYNLIWSFYGGMNIFEIKFFKTIFPSLDKKIIQLIENVREFYQLFNNVFNFVVNKIIKIKTLDNEIIDITFSLIYREMGLFKFQERDHDFKLFSNDFINLSKKYIRKYFDISNEISPHVHNLNEFGDILLFDTHNLGQEVIFRNKLLGYNKSKGRKENE